MERRTFFSFSVFARKKTAGKAGGSGEASVYRFNDDRYKSLVLSIHILLRQQGGDGGRDIA